MSRYMSDDWFNSIQCHTSINITKTWQRKRTEEATNVIQIPAMALLSVAILAIISNPAVGLWQSIQNIFIPDATALSLEPFDQNKQVILFNTNSWKKKVYTQHF